MRFLASLSLSAILLAGCASGVGANSGPFANYTSPNVGMMVTVKAVDENSNETRLQQLVVAQGKDFAVYKNISNDNVRPSKDDFFIEFSGLYWQVCSEPLASASERRALKKMWPLEEGASTQVLARDGAADRSLQNIAVEQVGVFVSDVFGEQSIFKVRTEFTTPEITMYAPELKSPLIIDWGEIGADDYAGFDELVQIDQIADLSAYSDDIDFAKANCTPSALR